MEKETIILGIESSCDETAAAVVKGGRFILSNIISSQIKIHERYGGVVPEIASRNHVYDISSVVDAALKEAGVTFNDLDAIAVTYGPGLIGALLVGLSYSKALSFALGKQLIGVNHIEGHIFANFIEHKNLEPPLISLVVSGGHTHLVYMADYNSFEILGHTKDDAAGEAFDKVARALGLGYPGGPKVEQLAKEGNPFAINFPRAMSGEVNLDFSFSGLKSAVLNYLNKAQMMGQEVNYADVAASFQQAVVDVLVDKAMLACRMHNVKTLTLSGGVACNKAIRDAMEAKALAEGINFLAPSPILCTDNAAMIASRGHYSLLNGYCHGLSLNAFSSLSIGEKVIAN